MIILYKITNIVNGKVYIGQTKNSLLWRFKSHCSKYSCCTKLKHAISKYDKHNFKIEQIDHAHTREEADSKEVFWIGYYKSTQDEFGYNILEGGHKAESINKKRVICLETKEVFESVTDVAEKLNCKTVETIARVCRGERPTFQGCHYAFLDKNDKPILDKIRFDAPRSHKKTLCVETGVVFEDSKKASDWLKVSRNAVSMCCRGLCKTCGGYHWKYV